MNDLHLTRRHFVRGFTFTGITTVGLARSRVLATKTPTALPPIGKTPGVRQVGNASITDASEAAQLAVSLAQQSAAAGTFGVGGLLVDGHGRILAEAVNSVLIGGALYDPTCHVERQLIDWFTTNQGRTRFARDDLTIVNSLDPCAMCAGAIIRSGMKAVSVSEDTEAGIQAARNAGPGLEALKQQVSRHFAFFAVRGGRSQSGIINNPKLRSSIAEALVVDAKQAVFASVADVRQTVGKDSNRAATPWQPVASMLSKIDELAARLSKLFERVGSPINVHRAKDRAQLWRVVAKSNCALVDSRGYVITSVKRDWSNAVTGSSVMNAVRLYTHLRRLAAEMLNIELPSSRHCSLIMHQAPHSEAEMLMELGAIGSFLECGFRRSRPGIPT